MPDQTRLDIRATVWGHADNRLAALLVEGLATPYFPIALLRSGLTLVPDPHRLALPHAPGWHVRLVPDDTLTLRWPHRGPLLAHAPVDLPATWRWAARRRSTVLLLAGPHLGLTRHTAAARQEALEQAAADGMVVGAAVSYVEERAAWSGVARAAR
ncbi:hypothetical protein [Actinokineospora enzanensis]|uniref:hypothetical protein n=1 Tax=Actinokineospora enzanensis TaxID=155975 RepID=UPI00035EDA75|nr:hypothetical protein [Actinokineospora enzanensis]